MYSEKVKGHRDVLEKLNAFKNLPNVFLFLGSRNIGKTHVAFQFIRDRYLCDPLYNPDVHLYNSEKDTFRLEFIHTIQEEASLAPFKLDKKFFILKRVDLMSTKAANASLKLLEDSAPTNCFILTAENDDKVPLALRSRSVVVSFCPIDVREYYPDLTDEEVYLIGGCLGNYEKVVKLNVPKLYNSLKLFIRDLKFKSYENIFDTVDGLVEYNHDLLDLLFLILNDLYKETDENIYLDMISEVIELNRVFDFKVIKKIHFRNIFLNFKTILGKPYGHKEITRDL